VDLVRRAVHLGLPCRAVVADSFYGEDRGVRRGVRDLGLGYVLALKPSHSWWHSQDACGSLQEAARAARWKRPQHPGKWKPVLRTFQDGSSQPWWVLEVVAGPYGPDRPERAVIATTDPHTLPEVSTLYLVTNLPAPDATRAPTTALPAADLAEVVHLYGLRMWVEQGYKQIKHALGWAHYHVRSATSIRRHWQLVCCAFCFCWYHAGHVQAMATPADSSPSQETPARKGKKIGPGSPPPAAPSWPMALRAVRGWLEPWIMLTRYWKAWSPMPPPPALRQLLHWLESGHAIDLYCSV
jgi:DDE superfamily endonuclease